MANRTTRLEHEDGFIITLSEAFVFLRLMAMPGVEGELRRVVAPYLESLAPDPEMGWSLSEWRADIRARPEVFRVRQRFMDTLSGPPLTLHREPVGRVQVEAFPSLAEGEPLMVGRGSSGPALEPAAREASCRS